MIFALQGQKSSRPVSWTGFKKLKSEVAEFHYIGLNIKKTRENVKLWQNEYKKIHRIEHKEDQG